MKEIKAPFLKGLITTFILLTIFIKKVWADILPPLPYPQNRATGFIAAIFVIILIILSYYIYILKFKKHDDD